MKFIIGQTYDFTGCAHPPSRLVGIDHYTLTARDGQTRRWESYTLEALSPEDRRPPYDRWYVVDLPGLGLSFVQLIDKDAMPAALKPDDTLSGQAQIRSDGDAALGSGNSTLEMYIDESAATPVRYAEEPFENGGTLTFKITPLGGAVQQSSP
jgi:hypothetical protein